MAFPETGILDNFNRANEGPPPSASWSGPVITTTGQARVVSNAVTPAAGVASTNYWNTSFAADQEAYVKGVTGLAAGNEVFLRLTAPNTANVCGYTINIFSGSGGVRIFRLDNGTRTQLGATITQTFTDGDSFGGSVVGDVISAYYKVGAGAWTLLGTRTDATYGTAGYVGINVGTGCVLDDFGGGALAILPDASFQKVSYRPYVFAPGLAR